MIDDLISGLPRQASNKSGGAGLLLPCVQSIMVARDDVHSTLQSLAALFNKRRGSGNRSSGRARESGGSQRGSGRERDSVGSKGSSSRRSAEEGDASLGSSSSHASLSLPPKSRTVPKIVYTLSGPVPLSVPAAASASGSEGVQWV